MGAINIANSKNRDAVVNTETVRSPLRVRWLDEKGRQAQNVRILRCTVDRDCDEMVKNAGGIEKVSELLVKGDPEIDIENYGRFIKDTSRVYIDQDKRIVHKVQEWEIVRNIDGSERERRPRRILPQNTSTETPLKWSGKLMKKAEVYNKFVFATKLQIVHVNGLTFDFLFAMAQELEEKQSLMLVGAGPKGNQPLIFHRGGTQYRGFLEGRTKDGKYSLILHLSNMELKAPEPPKQEVPPATGAPAIPDTPAALPATPLPVVPPAKTEVATVTAEAQKQPQVLRPSPDPKIDSITVTETDTKAAKPKKTRSKKSP